MEKNKTTIEHFKSSINKEKVINLNFSYLSNLIENWWEYVTDLTPMHLAKFQLIHLLLQHGKKEDITYFDKLGSKGISAVCITDIFTKDCPRLSMLVHEALSELFALNDIKYPYEEHKKLYLKPNGLDYKDWGNGYGEITPHSDDLYEEFDVDFLSLTVCRDNTNTPTKFYFPKDIFKNFSNSEIERLFNLKVKFLSGKNVQTLKSRDRKVVDYSEEHGYKFFLDFRIDKDVGERMLPINCEDRDLIDKMRKNISMCPHQKSISRTGTFLIVANYKVLHARGKMNINKKIAEKIASHSDFSMAPRLLYRSKGQDAKVFNNL